MVLLSSKAQQPGKPGQAPRKAPCWAAQEMVRRQRQWRLQRLALAPMLSLQGEPAWVLRPGQQQAQTQAHLPPKGQTPL